jgi:hypothetical protein
MEKLIVNRNVPKQYAQPAYWIALIISYYEYRRVTPAVAQPPDRLRWRMRKTQAPDGAESVPATQAR